MGMSELLLLVTAQVCLFLLTLSQAEDVVRITLPESNSTIRLNGDSHANHTHSYELIDQRVQRDYVLEPKSTTTPEPTTPPSTTPGVIRRHTPPPIVFDFRETKEDESSLAETIFFDEPLPFKFLDLPPPDFKPAKRQATLPPATPMVPRLQPTEKPPADENMAKLAEVLKRYFASKQRQQTPDDKNDFLTAMLRKSLEVDQVDEGQQVQVGTTVKPELEPARRFACGARLVDPELAMRPNFACCGNHLFDTIRGTCVNGVIHSKRRRMPTTTTYKPKLIKVQCGENEYELPQGEDPAYFGCCGDRVYDTRKFACLPPTTTPEPVTTTEAPAPEPAPAMSPLFSYAQVNTVPKASLQGAVMEAGSVEPVSNFVSIVCGESSRYELDKSEVHKFGCCGDRLYDTTRFACEDRYKQDMQEVEAEDFPVPEPDLEPDYDNLSKEVELEIAKTDQVWQPNAIPENLMPTTSTTSTTTSTTTTTTTTTSTPTTTTPQPTTATTKTTKTEAATTLTTEPIAVNCEGMVYEIEAATKKEDLEALRCCGRQLYDRRNFACHSATSSTTTPIPVRTQGAAFGYAPEFPAKPQVAAQQTLPATFGIPIRGGPFSPHTGGYRLRKGRADQSRVSPSISKSGPLFQEVTGTEFDDELDLAPEEDYGVDVFNIPEMMEASMSELADNSSSVKAIARSKVSQGGAAPLLPSEEPMIVACEEKIWNVDANFASQFLRCCREQLFDARSAHCLDNTRVEPGAASFVKQQWQGLLRNLDTSNDQYSNYGQSQQAGPMNTEALRTNQNQQGAPANAMNFGSQRMPQPHSQVQVPNKGPPNQAQYKRPQGLAPGSGNFDSHQMNQVPNYGQQAPTKGSMNMDSRTFGLGNQAQNQVPLPSMGSRRPTQGLGQAPSRVSIGQQNQVPAASMGSMGQMNGQYQFQAPSMGSVGQTQGQVPVASIGSMGQRNGQYQFQAPSMGSVGQTQGQVPASAMGSMGQASGKYQVPSMPSASQTQFPSKGSAGQTQNQFQVPSRVLVGQGQGQVPVGQTLGQYPAPSGSMSQGQAPSMNPNQGQILPFGSMGRTQSQVPGPSMGSINPAQVHVPPVGSIAISKSLPVPPTGSFNPAQASRQVPSVGPNVPAAQSNAKGPTMETQYQGLPPDSLTFSQYEDQYQDMAKATVGGSYGSANQAVQNPHLQPLPSANNKNPQSKPVSQSNPNRPLPSQMLSQLRGQSNGQMNPQESQPESKSLVDLQFDLMSQRLHSKLPAAPKPPAVNAAPQQQSGINNLYYQMYLQSLKRQIQNAPPQPNGSADEMAQLYAQSILGQNQSAGQRRDTKFKKTRVTSGGRNFPFVHPAKKNQQENEEKSEETQPIRCPADARKPPIVLRSESGEVTSVACCGSETYDPMVEVCCGGSVTRPPPDDDSDGVQSPPRGICCTEGSLEVSMNQQNVTHYQHRTPSSQHSSTEAVYHPLNTVPQTQLWQFKCCGTGKYNILTEVCTKSGVAPKPAPSQSQQLFFPHYAQAAAGSSP